MADSNRYSRWYIVLFFVFVILIFFICGYNLYETYRIKTQVPQDFHESQDILIVLNIIGIVIALILLIGYYFAGDKTAPCSKIINSPLNASPTNDNIAGFGIRGGEPVSKPSPFCRTTPSPFCRTTPIDLARL